MKIIVDECLPKRLIQLFPAHDTWTVPQIGLLGSKDGDLLDELDARSVDIFITIDGNIEYQQRFIGRKFGTIIVHSVINRIDDLLRLESELTKAVNKATSGTVLHVPDS